MSQRARRALISVGVLASALAVAAPVNAISVVAPNVIGFESDPAGVWLPEPFTSLDNPTVHFFDSFDSQPGGDLDVNFDGSRANGKGLRVFHGDPSGLIVRFDVPTRRLAIRLGDDFGLLGDRATLKVFDKAGHVATIHKTLNLNGDGDQFIEYKGRKPISRATLVYNRNGTPLSIVEVLDDFTLAQVCQIKGNAGPNRLVGNGKPNGICGLGGADRLFGKGGNDVLVAGNGNDRANGGPGKDLIAGGGGNDTLTSKDGVAGNDTVYGGSGNDTCTIDAGDQTYSCETVLT